jgi:hypothetical protein
MPFSPCVAGIGYKLSVGAVNRNERNGRISLLFQRRHPLPRIRQFGEGGVFPEEEESVKHRLRKIMSGPNLAETKQIGKIIGEINRDITKYFLI